MPVKVHMRHIRAAKLCSRGAREWAAAQGIPWNDFLDNGVDADRLEATGDPFAMKASAIARQEIADGRRG